MLGDLNHGLQTIEDRNWWFNTLRGMKAHADDEVVIVRGNHDRPHELDCFGFIPHVTVFDRPGLYYHRNNPGTMIVLPYPSSGALVGTGADGAKIFQDYALDLLESASAASLDGQHILTVGHFNVGGAIASTGQPQIGREIELDAGTVDKLAIAGPVFLGHIHKPQLIGTSGNAWYAGSVAPSDWGELEQKIGT